MNYLFIGFVFTSLVSCSFSAVLPRAGCSISVNQHLGNPQPLLLLQNDARTDVNAFPLPEDDRGTLTFAQGEKIDLACPGGSVIVSGSNTGSLIKEATCSSGVQFTVNGKTVAFNRITCTKAPFHTARYTGNTCATDKREIEIGFDLNTRFIRHITSCFDDDLQHVLYSRADLTSTIGGFQSGFPRPDFIVGNFFHVQPDSVNTLYTRNGQRKTINRILGLSDSDTKYIHQTNDYFLSRGHYVAKADYVYGSQQRMTFHYINVAPQWQTFNGGNWNTLENNCRNMASDRGLDLVVYSGSHGVATLPDTKNQQQELYLWSNGGKKGIPVPAVFYRVVYDPKNKSGIALVGINNPYKTDVKSDVICTDVCDKVKWLTWKRTDLKLGYSYCCEIDEFRKTVTVLPEFEVNSLLV